MMKHICQEEEEVIQSFSLIHLPLDALLVVVTQLHGHKSSDRLVTKNKWNRKFFSTLVTLSRVSKHFHAFFLPKLILVPSLQCSLSECNGIANYQCASCVKNICRFCIRSVCGVCTPPNDLYCKQCPEATTYVITCNRCNGRNYSCLSHKDAKECYECSLLEVYEEPEKREAYSWSYSEDFTESDDQVEMDDLRNNFKERMTS